MKFSIFDGPTEDRPMLALGLLLFGVSLLSLQDSLIKLFAPQTSFWQLQLVRSSFNMLFAVGLAPYFKSSSATEKSPYTAARCNGVR